jgi:hypothetical protein
MLLPLCAKLLDNVKYFEALKVQNYASLDHRTQSQVQLSCPRNLVAKYVSHIPFSKKNGS